MADDWSDGYRRALRDIEYLARGRDCWVPWLDHLLRDMTQDARVIAHERNSREQKKQHAAEREAGLLFPLPEEEPRPLVTRPR
jgi:hypothetical protein